MSDSAEAKSKPAESLDPADWVKEHGDVLFRFAVARVRRREIAEELVQDTFLAAVRAADSFEGRSKVRTWLTSILKNKIIDYMRKSARKEEPAKEPEQLEEYGEHFNRFGIWNRILGNWASNPDEILEGKQFSKVLAQCIEKLPQQPRRAFLLKTVDNHEAEEVCKSMDISPSNFWVLMHRARMALRECIELNWVKAK